MNILSEAFTILCYSKIEETAFSENFITEKIRKYRNLLFSIFRELTLTEDQHFSDLHSRVLYISDIYKIDSRLFKEINGMRIFFYSVVHSNNVSVDSLIDNSRSVKWLCNTLNYFSGIDIPGSFSELFTDTNKLTFVIKPVVYKEVVEFLPATILEVNPPAFNEHGNTFSRIRIKTEEEDIYSVNLYDKWQNASRYLFKYANINLFNIRKNINDDKSFSAGTDSLLVLEPDVLLEASTLADCFQLFKPVYLNYFLKKFVYSELSGQMLKGNIVNYVLDELITSPNFNFDYSVKQCFRNNVFSSVKLNAGELNKIRKDIAEIHVPNIFKFSETLKNKNVIIEPTFISSKFGLQGRLDILTVDEKDENRKDIIELKSGKPPESNVWFNNKMQTIAYNLLLESAFTNVRSGVSSIFYSAAGINPLRNVANDKKSEQELLDLRNEIVFNEIKIASGDCSILDEIKISNFAGMPDFITTPVKKFEQTYSNLDLVSKKYFNAYTSFIFKEIDTLKTGSVSANYNFGYNALWRESLEEKIESASIFYGLKFTEYNLEKDFFIFTIPDNHPVTSFREGDICIIYASVKGKPEPEKQEILKCSVKSITGNKIELILRKKQLDPDFFRQFESLIVERDFMETGYNSLLQSIFDFASSPKNKQDILFGLKKPESACYKYYNPDLNPNQNEIISKAISANNYFLLQGPPGTGKTSSALINIVKELIKPQNVNKDIAIIAFTNRAVNEICKNFDKNKIEFLRLGDYQSEESYNLHKQINNLNYEQIKELISSTNIFVSTAHTFLGKYKDLSAFKNFSTVIVDEASQLIEPQLAGLLSSCDKFILIGDHKQLPSVVVQSKYSSKVSEKELLKIGLNDLSNSLFERLFSVCEKNGWIDAYGTLERHYRMHEDIAKLIQPSYKIELKSYNENQKINQNIFSSKSTNPVERVLSKSRVLFIPTKPNSESKISSEEAEKTLRLIETIKNVYGDKLNEKSIGIITPWRKQISNIRSMIKDKKLLELISIDTVERFQGSEKDVIILSLAVFNSYQLNNIQSISSDNSVDRKLNVAVSRAKNHLIILGCEPVLKQSPHYSQLISTITGMGGYIVEL